ncbi:glycosyltransferase [Rhodoflexus caldus]|uniref:glycosyltransferase n=1 Tax=Rhodoflexus caldus TaxID=2891236 RepID=UPI00202A5059|nr:glycosyltransferase [Rhodoflexus caldus]
MKVLHVSALDMGGAATAAIRLHKGLLKAGIDSAFLTLRNCNRNIPNKYIYEPRPEEISLLKVLKKTLRVRLGMESPHSFYDAQDLAIKGEPTGAGFSFPETLEDITLHPAYKSAHLIHLHWVAGWLDYPSFFAKNTKPVVWTLHDLNPFSGGLHYALGTSITEMQMGHLIDNPQDRLQQAHNRNLTVKQQSLQDFRSLAVVSPSVWLQKQSAESLLFSRYENHHIPNGLDTELFKPYDRSVVRGLLGLADKKTLLFIADAIDSPLKGFRFFRDALLHVQNMCDYQLLVVGLDKSNALAGFNNVHHMGYVQDERLMAMIYNAADAFVLPSLMDNFPNTMLESIACGTPVIAFPTGGIPEAIRHGENGLICEKADAANLGSLLEAFYRGQWQFDREHIAEQAAKTYEDRTITTAYRKVYHAVMATV